MGNYRLNDLKELVENYSGNDNPTIWIKDDLEKDTGKSIAPRNIFIDDDGDIIIEVNVELLGDY